MGSVARYFLPLGLSKKAATSAISLSDICEARSVAACVNTCWALLSNSGWMERRVSRRLSLISGRVLVTLRSSSAIMPGTTSAIVCLTPISPRMASAAAMDATDGGAAGAAGAAGAVASAAQAAAEARTLAARMRPLTVRATETGADLRAGSRADIGRLLLTSGSGRAVENFDALRAGDDRGTRIVDEQ